MAKQLEITPPEAMILEICLPNEVHEDMPDLALQIGECLVSQKPQQIGVNERDLWLLRANIDPEKVVGKSMGIDIIIKIYALLLEYKKEHILQVALDLKVKSSVGETPCPKLKRSPKRKLRLDPPLTPSGG